MRIDAIKSKLSLLIEKDKGFKTFGSNEPWGGHQYLLNPTINELELTIFESSNNIKLPEDYKSFLSNICNGGAGPFYGLYSLEVGIDEANRLSNIENITNSFSKNFPISKQETDNFIKYYYQCIEDGEDDEIIYPEVPEVLTGVIFLSQYGCGWSYCLVIKGEMKGTVWLHGDYFYPIFDKEKIWTFSDWYEDWLDKSINELEPKIENKSIDKNTTILNYDGWKLNEIPNDILDCKMLKKLVLSRNNLTKFPNEILRLEELKVLDLSMTPITEIPDEIFQLRKLKRLRFNYNHHTTLPNTLSNLENLEELSMYYSYKLEKLPVSFSKIANLKYLHISNSSQFKELPDNIGELINLEMLNLTDCHLINKLPKSFSSLRKLKYLYLGSTKIESLPDGFENLLELEYLAINIESLDLIQAIDSIKNLPKLKTLMIVNQLTLPKDLSKLINVRKLVVTQNYELYRKGYKNLSLSEHISLIPNLEELDLVNNNQVNSLPENIGSLSKLKTLKISSTAIKKIPESISLISDLQKVEGNLDNSDGNNPFGILKEEKEKLEKWFPKAKIWIW
jgi:Leucine-rich repeat (LRR) protein